MAQAWILDDAHTKAHVFSDLQSKLSYAFCNLNLLERCFLAGDTNSADREGHRGLAQLGDSLMGFIVMSDGTERNLPRAVLQASSSEVRSKEHCGRIAKVLRLDQWLKLSERQIHNGVQPTTLKNVVAALVGAVWLDSHSYLAVVKVMIQMGLLNNAHHHDQQQAAAQDHEARNSDYWSLLPESDRTVPDAIQLRSPNSHDSPIQMMKSYNPPDECFQADLLTNADRREQFLSGCNDWHSPTQSPGAVSMQMASLESSSMQGISPSNDNGCPTSRVQLPLSESRELDTPDKQQGSANTESIMGSSSSMQELDSDEVEGTHQISSTPLLSATSQNPSGTRKRNYGGVRKPPGRKDNRKTPGRPKADNPATLIENYISSEDKKVHDAQRRAMVFAAMRTYQAMILKVRGNGKAGLAALAISVGDSSALSILKAAVQGLRSQTISDIIRIDIAMTISERLRLINRTGCCIELLRLMRNYHTVALWRDITTTERGGVDAFVVSTPESIASEVPRAGNPLHIMKAHVSQGVTSFGNAMEGAETPCIGRRLRKLGERLDRLVRAWGEGVLLLLGQTLTETRLLEARDGDYDRLVELMDVSEGARIREISHVAERILQYFRTEPSQVARLVLENTDDEILREIPRLSHDFVDLLRPLAGDSRLSSCSHL